MNNTSTREIIIGALHLALKNIDFIRARTVLGPGAIQKNVRTNGAAPLRPRPGTVAAVRPCSPAATSFVYPNQNRPSDTQPDQSLTDQQLWKRRVERMQRPPPAPLHPFLAVPYLTINQDMHPKFAEKFRARLMDEQQKASAQ